MAEQVKPAHASPPKTGQKRTAKASPAHQPRHPGDAGIAAAPTHGSSHFPITEIATVFLDNALQVRRYTPSATRIIKLIPGDLGRPLSDLVSDLDYPDLTADVREVMRAGVLGMPYPDAQWTLV